MLAGKFVKLHVENSGCVWEMEFERGKDSDLISHPLLRQLEQTKV